MQPDYPVDVFEYSVTGFKPLPARAIREAPLRILAGQEEIVRLQCTGTHPKFLTAGYLYSCGVIDSAQDLSSMEVDDKETVIEVRVELRGGQAEAVGLCVTSGLGRNLLTDRPGPAPIPALSGPWLHPEKVLELALELHGRSALYRLTRGCHNSSLCTASDMVLFRSDIGRHNAIDTIVGQCLMESIPTGDKMILSTGRVASEIVHKAARAGVPVLASTSLATAQAVQEARRYGLTLLGNIGRDGFWVYNDPGRLIGFAGIP